MNNFKNKSILFQFFVAILFLYLITIFFQSIFVVNDKWQNTYYSLNQIFCFFVFSSLIIVLINLYVVKKEQTQLGFVFLVLITLKCIVSYLFILPVLNLKKLDNSFEKINFFILFLVFLAIETVLTIQLIKKSVK